MMGHWRVPAVTADPWHRRKVFITGCTGLLGTWLTASLVDRGADVVGLVRDSVPHSDFFQRGLAERIVTVWGDVESYDLLERVINEYEIEAIFHLAAQTVVGVANANPRSTFSTNIGGTWNVLEAARRSTRIRAVVVASSDKAYGTQAELPYCETAPLVGRHPYDVSKSCADLIAQAYWHSYGLPVAITRCGNFYGGGDLNFNRLVPGTIRSVMDGQRPIIRSDGTLIRDYFYVKDGVTAYTALAERLLAGECGGRAYNFSNEVQVTVLELTQRILELMGRRALAPDVQNTARNEIPHQYLSAEQARRELGWKAQYTLEQGLKETIAWYTDFLGRAKAR